jgi:hypothetical protein
MTDIRRGRIGQPLCTYFVRCGLAEIARHGFLPLFAMGFIQIQTLFSRHSARRTLKRDTVFRSFLFSDSQIPRLPHELRRHGGNQKARSHLWWPWQNEVYPVRADSVPFSGNDPQPIRSITPSRFPPPSDVNPVERVELFGSAARSFSANSPPQPARMMYSPAIASFLEIN